MPIHAKKPKCYSKGGKVHDEDFDRNRETGHEKGVHYTNHEGRGNSPAGSFSKSAVRGNTSLSKEDLNESAKGEHRRVLGEMRADKTDRRNLAEGGDVSDEAPVTDPMDEHESGESEIGEALVDELMTAMEHKDHKQVREAIEAIVMNCLSKGGM